MTHQREDGTYKAVNLESRLPRRAVVFAWDMHYSCNYRCPYCFYTHAGWTELAKKNLYQTPDKWEEVWSRVAKLYGRCQLRITAGEPFTYPHFDEVVARLSKIHDLQITTNASQTDAIRRLADSADPKAVELDCTFHPIWGELVPFAENVSYLRSKNFVANVCFLAYPPQMPKMVQHKNDFAQRGLYMNMAIFWGQHDGKQYPFAYTPEERRQIKDTVGVEIGPELVNLDPLEIRGKVCGAGQRYAVVQADGKVYRCGQLAREELSIGSLFDPEFRLWPEAKACTVDYCRSKEYQSAWTPEEKTMLDRQNKVAA